MSTNIGMLDRAIRIAIGALLLAFAFGYIYPATGWNWAGWIGVVPVLTALVGWCPLYAVLGISSYRPASA